eukprot:TRINITY_DN2157_c0_g2_i1.p2 TRINITY_DN2157_c0_g2~~TRINITY_DN2157_c0_g2_i1.p2  ORF type:complete len:255 (-),score=21.40 TRINITY_DN2157_c0_g2_i1:495-1166(-)
MIITTQASIIRIPTKQYCLLQSYPRLSLCTHKTKSKSSLLSERKLVTQHIRCAVAEEQQQQSSDAVEDTEHPQEIRRCLLSLGWDDAWIDGILQMMQKGKIKTSVQTCRAAVEYLESVGIPKYMVQNMVSINHRIVSKDVETELKPIVEYLKGRGMSDPSQVLEFYPYLFDFTVGADNKTLEKGERGRVQVDVFEGDKYQVHFWREGAKFKTSPIAPWQPQEQ